MHFEVLLSSLTFKAYFILGDFLISHILIYLHSKVYSYNTSFRLGNVKLRLIASLKDEILLLFVIKLDKMFFKCFCLYEIIS